MRLAMRPAIGGTRHFACRRSRRRSRADVGAGDCVPTTGRLSHEKRDHEGDVPVGRPSVRLRISRHRKAQVDTVAEAMGGFHPMM